MRFSCHGPKSSGRCTYSKTIRKLIISLLAYYLGVPYVNGFYRIMLPFHIDVFFSKYTVITRKYS